MTVPNSFLVQSMKRQQGTSSPFIPSLFSQSHSLLHLVLVLSSEATATTYSELLVVSLSHFNPHVTSPSYILNLLPFSPSAPLLLSFSFLEGIAEPPQRSTLLQTKAPETSSFSDTRGYVTGYAGHVPGKQVFII